MKTPVQSSPALATSPPAGVALERRNFLRGRFKEAPAAVVVRPPWTNDARIAAACTGCGDCSRACPEDIVSLGADGTPQIDFSLKECSFCGDCATACDEAVFAPMQSTPWRLSLSISAGCLAASGTYCRSCGDACAEAAIKFEAKIGGAAEIWFEQADCSGCGACVSACPVGATSLAPAAAPGGSYG